MLVLSRRETEKVLFPTLGISVEVLRVQGSVAKLGIDAPAEIPILRNELAKHKSIDWPPDAEATKEQLRDLAHAVRQRLDSASITLNRLHERLDDYSDSVAQEFVIALYRDLQALEREASQALEQTSAAKSIQVLVVEDSVVERTLLASVLELSGMTVHTASDGRDALDYLSMHATPDAVLLDMLMPRCDGPCFVSEVRANPAYQQLKIFAVSSVAPSELGLETGCNGINGWFPKPFEPGELVSVLSGRASVSTAV